MPLLWEMRREIDMCIEPHIVVPNEDYAGFYDEIKKNRRRNLLRFTQ